MRQHLPTDTPSLRGIRVLTLALNLPGPAAVMRLRAMGARCTKLEPPPPVSARARAGAPQPTADPMGVYERAAYDAMHEGIAIKHADLKTAKGQAVLHRLLARTDVLITSFRPSALDKLGLDWKTLHARHPALCMVRIVGARGARADEAGHDLTYQAERGLVDGLHLPVSLFADMGGSLFTTEAVLQALLQRASPRAGGRGVLREVGLSEAAAYLALPRQWGLTTPEGQVGGAHVGYGVYPCRDGRVALAALEPHFARRLCQAMGLPLEAADDMFADMFADTLRRAIARFFKNKTRAELDRLAVRDDIPLHTMASQAAPVKP